MSDGRHRGGGADTATRHGLGVREERVRTRGGLRDDVVERRRHDPRSEDYEEPPSTGLKQPVPDNTVTPQPTRPFAPKPPANVHDTKKPCLAPELVQRLDEARVLFERLGKLNHYALLGIATHASPKQVRAAYFALSKRFHPDTFFRKEIGGARAHLEGVFDALTRAYETLRRQGTRNDYDDSIQLAAERRFRPDTPSGRPKRDSVPLPPERESDRVMREVERRVSVAPPRPTAPEPMPAPRTGTLSMPPLSTPRPSGQGPRPSNQTPRPPRIAGAPPRDFEAPTGLRAFVDPGTGTQPEPRHAALPPPPAGTLKTPVDRPPAPPTQTRPNPFDDPGRASTQLRELDQLVRQRMSQPPPARPSMAPPRTAPPTDSAPPTGTRPSGPLQNFTLLELAEHFRGLGGMRHWASQRLRDASDEEAKGHIVDALNILRIVTIQLKDPHLDAHVQRLGRLVATKTAPAHRARAKAAEAEGQLQEAAELWQRVRDGLPDDAMAAFHHARVLMAAGDLKSAGRAAMRASELAPEHIETRELLIAFFDQMGMKLNARRERDTVQRLLETKGAQQNAPPNKGK